MLCFNRDLSYFKSGLILTIVIYSLNVILALSVYIVADIGNPIFISLRFIYLIAMGLLFLYVEMLVPFSLFPWLVMLIYIGATFFNGLDLTQHNEEYLFAIALECMYTNVVTNHISGLMFGFILTSLTFTIVY